jgi:hypothetical protein
LLIGSYSVLNKSCARFTNGTSTAGAYAGQTKSNFRSPSVIRSQDVYWPSKSSFPSGYNVGSSIRISRSSGEISSFTTISGSTEVLGVLWEVKLLESPISGVGTINEAQLSLLSPLDSALSGSGTITEAILLATSGLASSLSGDGSISAQLSSIVPLATTLGGSCSLSVSLNGIGRLEADITPFTDLSPEGLAASLLDNSDIESGYSLREAMRLVMSSLVGKVSGAGTTTITIRNVPDTKDRIIATVDSNGNRTAITYDVGD